jgi:hypothetical protein
MTTIEDLDAEIARLEIEVRSVAQMPRTIAERFAEAEVRLREAEGVYRQWGFDASAGHPGEDQHVQRQALIGACMVLGADKLLKAERQRVEAQGEGLSPPAKAERLDAAAPDLESRGPARARRASDRARWRVSAAGHPSGAGDLQAGGRRAAGGKVRAMDSPNVGAPS